MTRRLQWENSFNTNIHPMFYLSKYALPHMKSGSTIINCASVNPYIGRGDLLDYTSTKGAIVAFTRGLSNQQVHKGIRVNCVCPGPSKFFPSPLHTGPQLSPADSPQQSGRPLSHQPCSLRQWNSSAASRSVVLDNPARWPHASFFSRVRIAVTFPDNPSTPTEVSL